MTRKFTSLPFTEYPVGPGHYDTSRLPITKIVLHSSASTRQGLIDTFGGGTRMVSTHYGIDNDGSILAFLEETSTAYAVGNYPINQSSISVEHIDESSTIKLHTDQQYETSIKLIADLCKFYQISADSAHIVPHSAIVNTSCPNGLDVNRIIDGAKALLLPPAPQTPLNIDLEGFTTVLEMYGIISIETLKSKLLAKDSYIKNHPDLPPSGSSEPIFKNTFAKYLYSLAKAIG